jgi:hypothetical protein
VVVVEPAVAQEVIEVQALLQEDLTLAIGTVSGDDAADAALFTGLSAGLFEHGHGDFEVKWDAVIHAHPPIEKGQVRGRYFRSAQPAPSESNDP